MSLGLPPVIIIVRFHENFYSHSVLQACREIDRETDKHDRTYTKPLVYVHPVKET